MVTLKESQGAHASSEAQLATKMKAIEGCAFHEGEFRISNLPSLPKRIKKLALKPDIHGTGVSQLQKCLADSHGLELTYDWKFDQNGMTAERIMAKWFSAKGETSATFQMILQVGLDVSKACVVFGGPWPISKTMKIKGPKSCIEMTLDLDGQERFRELGEVATVERTYMGEKVQEPMRKGGEPLVRIGGLNGQTAELEPGVPLSELLQIDSSEASTMDKSQKKMQLNQFTAFVFNLEFALEVDLGDGDNSLTLIMKGTLEPIIGRLILLGWLQYVWCNPFKLGGSTCIANLELSVGVSPGVPVPTWAGGGGSFGIGKDCPVVMKKMFAGGKNGAVLGAVNSTCGHGQSGAGCMQNDPEIADKSCVIATFYIGLDLLRVWDSYITASFSKITLYDIFGWVTSSKLTSMKSFMKSVGFSKGMSFSYAAADMDMMNFVINSGVSFYAQVQIFSWKGTFACRFEAFPRRFTLEISLSPVSVGKYVGLYRSRSDYEAYKAEGPNQAEGPIIRLSIQFMPIGVFWVIKEMPKVYIECFATITGLLDAYAKIELQNDGFHSEFRGYLLNTWDVNQILSIKFPRIDGKIHLKGVNAKYKVQITADLGKGLSNMWNGVVMKFKHMFTKMMKRIKHLKEEMAKLQEKLGLSPKSLKEEMALVYAEEEMRLKLRRMRYEGNELGETLEEDVPRCCEGTKEERIALGEKIAMLGLGEEQGAMFGKAKGFLKNKKSSVTKMKDKIKAKVKSKKDKIKAKAKKRKDRIKAKVKSKKDKVKAKVKSKKDKVKAKVVKVIKSGNAIAKAGKALAKLKKVFIQMVKYAKFLPKLLVILANNPLDVITPCGAQRGGSLEGPEATVYFKNQYLIWHNLRMDNLALNFKHPMRSMREIATTIKHAVLAAFSREKSGNSKCTFEMWNSPIYSRAKGKLPTGAKLPSPTNMKGMEKPKPKKRDAPSFNATNATKVLTPDEMVDAERQASEKATALMDKEANKKDEVKLEADKLDIVRKKTNRLIKEGKKQLLDAAIITKSLVDAKDSELHGSKHPFRTEVNEKAKIGASVREKKAMEHLIGLGKLQTHISPLNSADAEEKVLIHAFIMGYAAGDRDATTKFGAGYAKKAESVSNVADVAAQDIKTETLVNTKDAFQAGYASRYAEIRNVARKLKSLLSETMMSAEVLGTALTMDEEL